MKMEFPKNDKGQAVCPQCGLRVGDNGTMLYCRRCFMAFDDGKRLTDMQYAFALNIRVEKARELRRKFNGDDAAAAAWLRKGEKPIKHTKEEIIEQFGVRRSNVNYNIRQGKTIDEVYEYYKQLIEAGANIHTGQHARREKVDGVWYTIQELANKMGIGDSYLRSMLTRFDTFQEFYNWFKIEKNRPYKYRLVNVHGCVMSWTEAARRVGLYPKKIEEQAKEDGLDYEHEIYRLEERTRRNRNGQSGEQESGARSAEERRVLTQDELRQVRLLARGSQAGGDEAHREERDNGGRP